ncbi:MAG: septum formation initiator family protein [Acidobacteriota bacterium]
MLSNTAKKHLFYLVCLVLVIFYSYLLVFGDGGMLRLQQEEQKLMEASKLRNEELKEFQELQEKVDRITNNEREVERIARERYKMAQPGEIIVNIDE